MTAPYNSDGRIMAISTALATYLDAQQTIDALQLWHQKYAHQPRFSVQYFARDCCILLGIEGQRSELLKNLVRELYLQLHKLDNIQLDKKD